MDIWENPSTKNIQGELASTIEFARPGGIMEEGRMFLNDAKKMLIN